MILTIGDSFTFGEELENRYVAWPYLVSEKLEQTVTNLGKGGASTDRCFRLTIEQVIRQSYDLVIVAWPFPNRIEVTQNNEPVCINHNNRRDLPWVPDYFKYSYNEQFSFERWICQVLALQAFLKQQNQRYLFVNVAGLQGHWNEYQENFRYLWDQIDNKYYVGWPTDGMLEFQGDCAKGPGGHPLELGHRRIAKVINEHIRNLSWLS